MPQTAALIETLKTCLKTERKTYRDVAALLGLSEASVKRLFAAHDFTLERLEAICQMLGMELSDLVQKMNASRQRVERLTPQQEREVTEDIYLLIVTVCVFSHWTVEQITQYYVISEAECVRRLLRLDQMKLIELLPGNRVKLLLSPNFNWLPGGPIQQFFRQTVGREFFDTAFDEEGDCLLVLNGMLSGPSAAELGRRLEKLAREFNEITRQDSAVPFEKRNGKTLVMALRGWEYTTFLPLMRK